MKKTYITNISLQGRGDLLKVCYKAVMGRELKNNRETSFPIIPVLADHQEDGDDTTVLAIRSNSADTPDNYAVFLNELSELGIQKEQVKEITISGDQTDAVNLKLLMKILEEIPDDSIVYGDITFGTKPMSAILLYALSFVEKMKNCEVDGIYYGEIPRKGGKICGDPCLYDLTAFKLLGDVIDQMKDLELRDMQTALNRIIGV